MRRPRRARGLVLTACVLLLSACSLPGSPDAPQDPTPSASSDSTPTTTGRGVKTEPIEDATASEVTAADVAAAIGAAGLTDWPTAYERVGPLTIAAFPDALREGLEEAAPELLMVDSGFLDRAGPSLLAWAHAALAEDRMLYATSIDEQLAILEEALADVPPEQFAETVTNGSLQGTYPGLLLGNTFGPVEVSDPRFRMGWYLTFDTPLNDEHVFASASLFVVSTYLVNGTPMVLERELSYKEPLPGNEVEGVGDYMTGNVWFSDDRIDACPTWANDRVTPDPSLTEQENNAIVADHLAQLPEVLDREWFDGLVEGSPVGPDTDPEAAGDTPITQC
ncbi:hypothetical protein [Salana multivorans]